jgi:hypothetical protein
MTHAAPPIQQQLRALIRQAAKTPSPKNPAKPCAMAAPTAIFFNWFESSYKTAASAIQRAAPMARQDEGQA